MTVGGGTTNNSDSTTTNSYDMRLSEFLRVIKELQNWGNLNFYPCDGTKGERDTRNNNFLN